VLKNCFRLVSVTASVTYQEKCISLRATKTDMSYWKVDIFQCFVIYEWHAVWSELGGCPSFADRGPYLHDWRGQVGRILRNVLCAIAVRFPRRRNSTAQYDFYRRFNSLYKHCLFYFVPSSIRSSLSTSSRKIALLTRVKCSTRKQLESCSCFETLGHQHSFRRLKPAIFRRRSILFMSDWPCL